MQPMEIDGPEVLIGSSTRDGGFVPTFGGAGEVLWVTSGQHPIASFDSIIAFFNNGVTVVINENRISNMDELSAYARLHPNPNFPIAEAQQSFTPAFKADAEASQSFDSAASAAGAANTADAASGTNAANAAANPKKIDEKFKKESDQPNKNSATKHKK